jgi:hypothetical protein
VDRKPVEPPNALCLAYGKPGIAVLSDSKRVLAVFAESAVGVLEDLSAVPALNGKMTHNDLSS